MSLIKAIPYGKLAHVIGAPSARSRARTICQLVVSAHRSTFIALITPVVVTGSAISRFNRNNEATQGDQHERDFGIWPPAVGLMTLAGSFAAKSAESADASPPQSPRWREDHTPTGHRTGGQGNRGALPKPSTKWTRASSR